MATDAHELDELNSVDLETKLREAKEELFNLRFQAATGQLESHGRLRTVKKDIARIYTVVRERELGIRHRPGCERGRCRRMSEQAENTESGTRARSARASSSATRWTRPWSSPSRTASSTRCTARSCAGRRELKAHDEQNECGVGDRVLDHGDPPAVRHQALARRRDPREGEVTTVRPGSSPLRRENQPTTRRNR